VKANDRFLKDSELYSDVLHT